MNQGVIPQQDIVIEVPSLDNFLDGIINGYSNKTVPNDHIYEFLFNNSGPDFFGKLISDVMGVNTWVSYYIESFREQTITNHNDIEDYYNNHVQPLTARMLNQIGYSG